MQLTVVIPVLNEEKKILPDIDAAISFFGENGIAGEVIVVDDGSSDRTAEVVNRRALRGTGDVRLISYSPNRGKGFAVKEGVLNARGEIIMFIDSGNCIPYEDILPAIRMVAENSADISKASRFLKESSIMGPRPASRRFLSWMFRRFVRLYAGLPGYITDSQCGLSIYRSEVAGALYGELVSEGFMFDVEIIVRALSNGYRIVEFPVRWTPDPDSRLRPLAVFGNICRDLSRIRRMMNSW